MAVNSCRWSCWVDVRGVKAEPLCRLCLSDVGDTLLEGNLGPLERCDCTDRLLNGASVVVDVVFHAVGSCTETRVDTGDCREEHVCVGANKMGRVCVRRVWGDGGVRGGRTCIVRRSRSRPRAKSSCAGGGILVLSRSRSRERACSAIALL